MSPGVLVDTQLETLVAQGCLVGAPSIVPDQIQPNSLDLRVGTVAYRIKASFLPIDGTVKDRLKDGIVLAEIPLEDGGLLERDAVYLIPLVEELRLPAGVTGRLNPKSSTGRLDVFCRSVCDHAQSFDEVAEGYCGPLFLEVIPRSFLVRLSAGDRLSQLRLCEGDPVLEDPEIAQVLGDGIRIYEPSGRERPPDEVRVRGGIQLGVGLSGRPDSTIGFRGKPNHNPVDFSTAGGHSVRRYWERIHFRGSADVILEPWLFYIFASAERISLGPDYCAEMLPYDAGMGEIRSHYAGFFDSGFGWPPSEPANVVLEVRNYGAPYLLADRQILFRLRVMRNAQRPARLYGADGLKSNYQGQSLRLAKQFGSPKRPDPNQSELF